LIYIVFIVFSCPRLLTVSQRHAASLRPPEFTGSEAAFRLKTALRSTTARFGGRIKHFSGFSAVNIQVDQSGKFETSQDTVIAAAGEGVEYAVLVPKRVKNQVAGLFKDSRFLKRKSKKEHNVKLFALSVFLCLKNVVRQGDCVEIDEEYTGQDDRIKDLLEHFFNRFTTIKMNRSNFSIGRVGKESLAHKLAAQVQNGCRNPELEARVENFLQFLDKTDSIRNKAFEKRMKNKERKSG
jgi:hypothetical protein